MKTTSNHRPQFLSRFLGIPLLFALLVLVTVSCTRDRPVPEQATPAPAVPTETVDPGAAPAPVAPHVGGEPEIQLNETGASGEFTGTTSAGSSEPTIQKYEVQPGDTVLSIALEFDVEPDRLRELNFLQNDLIQVGQMLDVPMLPPTPVPTPEPFYHVVKSGESLGGIAALYGTSWKELTLANNLEDANALQAGMKLLIPNYAPSAAVEGSEAGAEGSSAAPSAAGGQAVHRVKPGETLSQIAQMYGVTTAQIVAANNLTSRNVIRTNQDLIIPGVSAADAELARSVRHTVAVGESLSQIAKQYGVEMSAIVKANSLINPDSVYVGQQLVIPVNEGQ